MPVSFLYKHQNERLKSMFEVVIVIIVIYGIISLLVALTGEYGYGDNTGLYGFVCFIISIGLLILCVSLYSSNKTVNKLDIIDINDKRIMFFDSLHNEMYEVEDHKYFVMFSDTNNKPCIINNTSKFIHYLDTTYSYNGSNIIKCR